MFLVKKFLKHIFTAIAFATKGGASKRCVRNFANLIVELIHIEFPRILRISSATNLENFIDDVAYRFWKHVDWTFVIKNVRNSSIWGRVFWQALHNLSVFFDGSERKREILLSVFSMLPFVLPCRRCRIHVQANLQVTQPELKKAENRESFMNAVISFHNLVTIQLKPETRRKVYPLVVLKSEINAFKRAAQMVNNHGRSSSALIGEKAKKTCDCR